MLAGDAATLEILRRRLGTTPMTAEAALSALPALLATDATSIGLARISWAEAGQALALLAEPAFEAVRAAAPPSADAADLRARLRTASEAEALTLLRETLVTELCRILRLPPPAVTADAPLAGLGLDSLGDGVAHRARAAARPAGAARRGDGYAERRRPRPPHRRDGTGHEARGRCGGDDRGT
ncbi:acyl carrier protein [Siccirubricoccus deserti]